MAKKVLSLDELGQKYSTDKASEWVWNNEKRKGHDYLRNYEIFLRDLKKKKFAILELGCFTGASLKMWKEYFPKATVIGVDLNPNLKSIEDDRIKFVCSNAVADDLPIKLKPYIDDLKVVIDDCSHAWSDQRRSFEKLFPLMKSGGYYIIEDLECGTMGAYPSYPPEILDSQLFWDYAMDRMKILRVSQNVNPTYYRPFFNQLPKFIQEIELSIDMAIIIGGSIIFRKK